MVFYTKTGFGKPLFLLHSGGMSHAEWAPQLPFLEKFYTVYCVDQPGHGQTPLQGSVLTIAECGEAVLEIMEKEGIASAFFCGSSMGGATALWLGMKHLKRVEKLILYRVNYRKNEAIFLETQKMSNPVYWQNVGLEKVLSSMHLAQGGRDAWKTVINHVSDALNPLTTDYNYPLEDLKSITKPVLIVCGDRDPLVPMSDLWDMYHTFPESDLWIMPHASHVTSTNTWRAESFAHEMHRFLSRKRPISL